MGRNHLHDTEHMTDKNKARKITTVSVIMGILALSALLAGCHRKNITPATTPTVHITGALAVSETPTEPTGGIVSTPQITVSPTPAPTATPTLEATATPTLEPTAEPTVSPEPTKQATATATVTPVPTKQATATATITPVPTKKATATPVPTKKATPTPTKKPTKTPTPTPAPTRRPVKTDTPTPTPIPEPTRKPSIYDHPWDKPVKRTDIEAILLQLLNDFRVRNGVLPFANVWDYDPEYAEFVLNRGNEIAARNATRLWEQTAADHVGGQIGTAKFGYVSNGEPYYHGDPVTPELIAQGIFDNWYNSLGHRACMLDDPKAIEDFCGFPIIIFGMPHVYEYTDGFMLNYAAIFTIGELRYYDGKWQ